MKSNYKRLGKYVEQIDERDTQMAVGRLLGVSIQKKFIPSIANTIGTDMSTYKVVRKNQFAYGPVTSRNGDKISIALLEDYDEAIVSQAYTTFKVTDEEQLLPEYLMMWFRRPEFDRYARFMSHGSVRELFEWEEMCNVSLPIPNLDKQKEIVNEFNVIQNRMGLVNAAIRIVEQIARAMYRRWFVEFEFPNDNRMPYKSGGGEMSDSHLGEIPTSWTTGILIDLIELQRGFDLPVQDRSEGDYPIFASTGITGMHNQYRVEAPGLVTGRSGSLGEVFYVDEDFWPLNTTLWVKQFKKATPIFAYYVLKGINISDYNSGSAVPTLNRNHIHRHEVIVPELGVIEEFESIQKVLFRYVKRKYKELEILRGLSEALLSKLFVA